ncbi:MAG: hypothetical protein FK731_05035 [Asgard group archaeon]|nr:hypothetical protein [Asgard group archaeon]
MILGIDVVFIHIKNPELMANWYEEKLGLKIGYSTPGKNWQEFNLNEKRPVTRFALDFIGSSNSRIEQQPIIISFRVENIYDAIKILESKGIEFYGKEKIIDVGPTLIATFCDPEGNFLQISQRKEG